MPLQPLKYFFLSDLRTNRICHQRTSLRFLAQQNVEQTRYGSDEERKILHDVRRLRTSGARRPMEAPTSRAIVTSSPHHKTLKTRAVRGGPKTSERGKVPVSFHIHDELELNQERGMDHIAAAPDHVLFPADGQVSAFSNRRPSDIIASLKTVPNVTVRIVRIVERQQGLFAWNRV